MHFQAHPMTSLRIIPGEHWEGRKPCAPKDKPCQRASVPQAELTGTRPGELCVSSTTC